MCIRDSYTTAPFHSHCWLWTYHNHALHSQLAMKRHRFIATWLWNAALHSHVAMKRHGYQSAWLWTSNLLTTDATHSPSKLPFPWADLYPRLLASYLNPADLPPLTASRSNQPFSTITGQTDRENRSTDGLGDIACTNTHLRSIDCSDAAENKAEHIACEPCMPHVLNML